MKKIVLAGGGHAHLGLIYHAKEFIKKGHSVTLISPSSFHYYSGMGSGMLAGFYRPEEIRFNVEGLIKNNGGRFIGSEVVGIDSDKKIIFLSSGEEVCYDILSFNIGSTVIINSLVGDISDIYTVKPIVNLQKARERIIDWPENRPIQVVVIGGGAAGVEVAGCVKALIDNAGKKGDVTLIGGRVLLHKYPEGVRERVLKNYKKRAIRVIEGSYVKEIADKRIILSEGSSIGYDIVFIATGVRPPEIFRKSGLPVSEDGGLLVNSYLQSVKHPEIFGGGDCISIQGLGLERAGVHAVKEGKILFHNLRAYIEGKPLKRFIPQKRYLLILNLGDGTGVGFRGNLVFNGKLAFRLKDYIDRRFMRST